MTRDFASVVHALSSEPGVTTGRMFGSEGLKVSRQVFSMEVKGRLVVKVSQERAAELCEMTGVEAFDPGHGRPMKQWVSVSDRAKVDWLLLSRESLEYVRSAKTKPKAKPGSPKRGLRT